MPRASNQKKKIFLVLQFLEKKSDEENPVSLPQIISYLEECGIPAERKSIYDDIEVLRDLGFDILFENGKGYYLASRDFQLPELKLLCDAVAASKFITPKKSDELIAKIKKLTSEEQAKALRRQVVVANRIKTMNECVYYSIDDIHRAIAEKRLISFKYFDINENKEKVYRHNGKIYVVEPLCLLWDDENYYLVAREKDGKIKHFRADKTEKVTVLDEKIPDDGKPFDIENYQTKFFGMYGGKEEAVWLKCENSAAGIISDRFGSDLRFIKADDKHFKVRVNVIVSPLFFSWVVGMNGKIVIDSPESTVAEFRSLIKKIEAEYPEKP